jgi:hypothetical protein
LTITHNEPPDGLSDLFVPGDGILARLHRIDAGESHAPVTAVAQALERAGRDDYTGWLEHIAPAAACTRPVRLRGESLVIAETTGRVLSVRSTDDMPDGALYKACGNRRATVCPACAEVYRADTYQLVLSGLNGGKGVPAAVQQHPFGFVTFTAPGFGAVHGTRKLRGRDGQWRHRACRPRRNPTCARMASTCAATRSTTTARPFSASRCAWTATTTTARSCGT